MSDTLILIDSKNLCYRAHWVHRFLESKGRPTSVLYGALKMLAAVVNLRPDTLFVFVWDGEGKTWRHEVTNGMYKGNRVQNPDVLPALGQLPVLKKVLEDAGFRQFEFPHLECDDLIGILTTVIIGKDFFKQVIVYSSDKDYYQLASNRVGIMRGSYNSGSIDAVMYGHEIYEETGCKPCDWVSIKALTGEVTDNIPQVAAKVGPKTAAKMIAAGLNPKVEEFKKLPWVVQQNFGLLAPKWKMVRQNYELAHIIREPDDRHFSDELRKDLTNLVSGLTSESFLKDKTKLTDEGLKRFTEFMVDFEMGDLFQDRLKLWRTP